jgi:hypothetical protein
MPEAQTDPLIQADLEAEVREAIIAFIRLVAARGRARLESEALGRATASQAAQDPTPTDKTLPGEPASLTGAV